jgi:hypothetical protein
VNLQVKVQERLTFLLNNTVFNENRSNLIYASTYICIVVTILQGQPFVGEGR